MQLADFLAYRNLNLGPLPLREVSTGFRPPTERGRNELKPSLPTHCQGGPATHGAGVGVPWTGLGGQYLRNCRWRDQKPRAVEPTHDRLAKPVRFSRVPCQVISPTKTLCRLSLPRLPGKEKSVWHLAATTCRRHHTGYHASVCMTNRDGIALLLCQPCDTTSGAGKR